jgi:predicted RNA-binding protein with TRAM domain
MSYGQNTRSFSGRTTGGSSKPVETGKVYAVDITDTGKDGEGVARIGGLIIFVKNAKAGAKNIKIKINSVVSNFATAEVAAAGSADTT